ncbi:MAG: transcription-repair coupling factor [Clostridia bacterium]|nr:transcription-repair coupling factor [Clostridia bacterium]
MRIEFYGDEIDTLHAFDPLTQRRTALLERALLPPASQLLPEGGLERLRQTLRDRAASRRRSAAFYEAALARLEEGQPDDALLPLLWDHPATLLDYLPDALLCLSEERACARRLTESHDLLAETLKRALEDGHVPGETEGYAKTPGEVWSALGRREVVFLEALPHGRYELAPKGLLSTSERHAGGLGDSMEVLLDEVKDLLAQGYDIALFAATEPRRAALASILKEHGAVGPGLRLLIGGLPAGVIYPEGRLALLTDRSAVPVRRPARPRKKTAGEKIRTYADLRIGDYVVHQNHGIGQYLGIVPLQIEGVTRDYIKIQYQGSDALFVPADQLAMVSKYISGDDKGKVKLSKMGGAEWGRTKQRVRKAAQDMARQLITLYAARQQVKGFPFEPDSDWQAGFEASFPYVETDDQLRCIDEVKRDMQRPVPMDRLLCGDVGFGKTEVALRAAFKAMENGKQVALLVPTTILSWQHFTNILNRFADYPMRIDNLSRFRSPRQQADVLRRLRNGQLDMVVGTHRLLQKDVVFKDLGLLIVDEEQRFGVSHKEKLKELTRSVDVLTLTATPIPRTLGMALSGIRDMSIIEEPPMDRKPVQTYVMEHDEGVIADALRRELRRGGQVFYLYNRVNGIERVAANLQKQLPDARIRTAHGKMGEDQLSEIWEAMVAGEIDILVCTTIIETGVDVPTANTLVVEDADRLGLSQLYQIRGRVGRSDRRAYAFFTYRKDKVLSEDATKRLSAIREFTQFGSGFKIAMRDLEIRGAGNVLGAEQHGHMEAVGYDLYLKLLEEAVLEEKGERPDFVHCTVEMPVDANIPTDYIRSGELRIDMYKKIAAIESDEDFSDFVDELCDRFGDPPAPLINLCRVSLLRNRAGRLGVEEIAQRSGNVVIDAKRLTMEQVSALSAGARGRVLYSAGSKPYLTIRPAKGESGLEAAEWGVKRIGEVAEQPS